MQVTPIFDRNLTLNLSAPTAEESGVNIDVLLDRSVAHSRAGYTLWAMKRWGIPTLNTAESVSICDDKARASMVLEAAGIPILGTSPDAIDLAEDRERFQALLARLGFAVCSLPMSEGTPFANVLLVADLPAALDTSPHRPT